MEHLPRKPRAPKCQWPRPDSFKDVDIALMAHPYYTYEKSGESLAMDAIQYEFFGRSAHAAAQPYEGINALDAVLQLFNAINALRQQTKSDARIHGIISEGGKAPNIIPDYAVAQFYVRSTSRTYTNELVQKVLHCAEGAALQTGCTLKTSFYEYSYVSCVRMRLYQPSSLISYSIWELIRKRSKSVRTTVPSI